MLARRFLCKTVSLVDSLTVGCKAMQFCLGYMIGSDRLDCLGGGGDKFLRMFVFLLGEWK